MIGILFFSLAFSGISFAEDRPEIKPGLWETRIFLHDSLVDAVAAQTSSHLDQYQQEIQTRVTDQTEKPDSADEECMSLEEALKMHDNIARGKAGYIDKECITPEQAKNYFAALLEDEDCTNKLQWLGNGRGVLSSTCTSGRIEHSEIDVKSQKEIVITTTSTEENNISGTSTWQGKWLADDCGSVELEN